MGGCAGGRSSAEMSTWIPPALRWWPPKEMAVKHAAISFVKELSEFQKKEVDDLFRLAIRSSKLLSIPSFKEAFTYPTRRHHII